MSITATTLPNSYMAGYSMIPLRISDTTYNQSENYKYLFNILWDTITINASTSYNYFGVIYTKLTSTTPHNFKKGDFVLLNDSVNNNDDTGYYNVLFVNSSTEFTINRVFDLGLGTNNPSVSRAIPYKMPPDPDGEAKLDLSNTLKDFVTENIEDVNAIYAAPNTRFNYDLTIGNESKYIFSFESNINSGDTLGFYNSAITATTGIPFQLGDLIYVEQDLYEWPYTDNKFYAGNIGFEGTFLPPFLAGQQILVTGQITNPQYNGYQTIDSINVGDNAVVTFEPFGVNTPAEGGNIYGTPRPDYNGVATIVAIFIDPTYGYTILTDKVAFLTTPTIGGTIRYADGRISSQPVLDVYTDFNVYNSHIKRPDWSITAFDPYVIQNRSASSNNVSTILESSSSKKYRIEKSAKSWLLAHIDPDNSMTGYTNGAVYEFYDSSNALLTRQGISNNSGNNQDFYFPVGYDQILNSPDLINYLTPLSAISVNNIAYYTVAPAANQLARTNKIYFYINDDCSRYELYNLVWKDSNGSLLAFPFQYLSANSTEVERKNYYQKEGSWDNTGFSYKSYDRGEKTYFLRSRDKIVLNSGWLTEAENTLIKDLMTSPYVMVQTPENYLISCVIEENNIRFKEDMNDQLINYTFNIRISYNETRL